MKFNNKVVLVTGASAGIGAVIAKTFAYEGANVVIVGRSEERLRNILEECEKNGKKHLKVKADLSKDEEAKAVMKETIDTFQKLDVVVNSAGVINFGTILDGTILKSYDDLMPTNLRAIIHITTLAVPHLVETKGNIINMSGVGGISVSITQGVLAHCVIKAGLDHFTRGAALELAASGVRVNSVSPGPIKTGILKDDDLWNQLKSKTALGKLGTPEELADLVMFIASDKGKSITGSTFVCDNGMLLKH